MFKIIEPHEHPRVMNVTAQAVWNEEKGLWEVAILQNETKYSLFKGEYNFIQTTHRIEVKDCDEFVIADALLAANGIDVQSLYDDYKNPIVKSE